MDALLLWPHRHQQRLQGAPRRPHLRSRILRPRAHHAALPSAPGRTGPLRPVGPGTHSVRRCDMPMSSPRGRHAAR